MKFATLLKALKPFIPQLLQYTLPSLNLETSIVANRGINKNLEVQLNGKQCGFRLDGEPSHLDLHCLYKYLLVFWSIRLKGLIAACDCGTP